MPLLRRRTYKKPKWPPGRFMLVDDAGADDGPYEGSEFGHEGDNVWVRVGYGSHPLILRVVRQEGDTIWSLDGTGQEFRYQMVSID
jgi:hypothetical protein